MGKMTTPMEPSQSSASHWLPLISVVVGYLLGFLSEGLRDRRAYKRERETRETLRRDQRIQRRNEFQLQMLRRLQHATLKLMQSTYKLHYADRMSASEFGVPRASPSQMERDNMLA